MRNMMTSIATVAVLMMIGAPAAAEQVTRLAGAQGEPALLVRHEPGPGPSVLYVHGATFPSASSISYRIDGRSWMDDLRARGFDVWAFDFAGYGGSDRPAAMYAASKDVRPFSRAPEAADQIERVVRHVLKMSGRRHLSIIAHSWGTLPAGLFAGQRPELVERLVLFGPVALRRGETADVPGVAARPVSAADQWQSFQSGMPAGHASPIDRSLFDDWAKIYLASDPESGARTPPSVMAPTGPQADIGAAWSGCFPYDPASVRALTLIVRGEWDSVTQDADAVWLTKSLVNVPGGARDVKLPQGAHRMHLETNRQALFDAVGAFLGETGRRP